MALFNEENRQIVRPCIRLRAFQSTSDSRDKRYAAGVRAVLSVESAMEIRASCNAR